MIRVAANFRERAALSSSQQGVGDGAFFVPEFVDVSIGSPVLIQVTAHGLLGGVFLEGVVAWRRVQAAGVLAKGTGVRVLTPHGDRLSFLLRWAKGDVPTVPRESPRFPCTERVLVSLVGSSRRATQRLVYGTLEDVSARGALLVTPSPLVGASDILVDVDSGRAAVQARVVWSSGNRSGLAIGALAVDGERAWSTVVERVARSLDPEVRVER
jgi:hypothetical protein